MTALAEMPAVEKDALSELIKVEAALAEVEDDALAGAWEWIRDVQALIKARKMAASIAIRAKRIEARLLRRLGEQPSMHSTARYVARNLREMSDSQFERFLLEMSDRTAIYSDVRKWNGEEEQRQRWGVAKARAAAGEVDESFSERVSVAEAANRLMADIIAEGDSVSSSEAIDELGAICNLDPTNEVNREGLQHLLSRAAAIAVPEGDIYTTWDGDDTTVPWLGRIPASVTYQLDGQWVRSSWSAASVAQLAANVAMVEKQAAERVNAARGLRGLLDQLRAVPAALGMDDIDDTAKASDVLMLGRVNGLIRSGSDSGKGVTHEDAAKAFPRLFEGCWDHFSTQHLVAMVNRLADYAITDESQLDEATAENLAEKLWTGSNKATIHSYLQAYAPRLIDGWSRRIYPYNTFGGDQ